MNQVWKAWVLTNHLSSSHHLDILAQVPWSKIARFFLFLLTWRDHVYGLPGRVPCYACGGTPPLASRSYEVKVRCQTAPRESRGGICLDRTCPWSDQGWIGQRSGCADQAAGSQPPKAKPLEHRFIGLACWLRSFGVKEREKKAEGSSCLFSSRSLWDFVNVCVYIYIYHIVELRTPAMLERAKVEVALCWQVEAFSLSFAI